MLQEVTSTGISSIDRFRFNDINVALLFTNEGKKNCSFVYYPGLLVDTKVIAQCHPVFSAR
jgi:hypothetical protein